jgi:hypothetical protein
MPRNDPGDIQLATGKTNDWDVDGLSYDPAAYGFLCRSGYGALISMANKD